MNEQKSNAAASRDKPRDAGLKSDAPPDTDLQPEDAGTAASGANRGSPAAPVMKEFAKTKTESSGRS